MTKYVLYYEPFHTIFSNLEDIINNSDEGVCYFIFKILH